LISYKATHTRITITNGKGHNVNKTNYTCNGKSTWHRSTTTETARCL